MSFSPFPQSVFNLHTEIGTQQVEQGEWKRLKEKEEESDRKKENEWV